MLGLSFTNGSTRDVGPETSFTNDLTRDVLGTVGDQCY